MRPAMPERQSSERFPVDLEGWLASETTGDQIACTVWDLSETRVRLVIPSPADVPLAFELIVPNEEAAARVQLVWMSGNRYGARFTGQLIA